MSAFFLICYYSSIFQYTVALTLIYHRKLKVTEEFVSMEMQHDDSKYTIIEKNDGFLTRKQSTDKISEIKAGNKSEFQDTARNGQFVQNGN